MGGWDAAGATGLLPTVEARPTQLTQLELPVVRQQKRPTRAEKLKRGARPAPLIPEVVPATQKELEAAGQLRLFDEEGNPTVAGLKGAGLKRKRPKPKASTDKQRGATGFRGKTAKEKAAEEAQRKAAEEAAEEAQRKAAEEAATTKVTLVSERKAKDATGAPFVELTLSDGTVRRIQRQVGSQTREGFTGWYDLDLVENPKPYQVAYIADTKQGAVNRILADTNAAPTQETSNALQEQGADEVSARGETGTGERVGPEVRRAKRPPGKGRSRKTQEEAAPESVPQEQTTDQEALDKAEAERNQRTADAIALAEANAQAAFDFRADYESLTDAIDGYRENLTGTLSEAKWKADQYIIEKALAAYDAYIRKNKRKKVTPAKKSEAALAAATEATPSAGEVTITVEVGEGEKRGGTPVNANELLAKVDSDIDRFKALLACLKP
jgi:hypothetical protein